MSASTYILYIKSSEATPKTLRIKASGYIVVPEGNTVRFEEADNVVAVFNMAEIVGFVESVHIVN